jgi:regulator of nucleoside diphosphate kinase
MAKRTIYITEDDARRLEELLKAGLRHSGRDMANLRVLQDELRRAKIVAPDEITPDVVTMYSCVQVRASGDEEPMVFSLVFPEQADPDRGRISVVAPIGAAVLGYKAGDTIRFSTPGGVQQLRIEQVLYQPESAQQVGA